MPGTEGESFEPVQDRTDLPPVTDETVHKTRGDREPDLHIGDFSVLDPEGVASADPEAAKAQLEELLEQHNRLTGESNG